MDYKNVFALTPTYDRLFEQGYITFDDEENDSVSSWISNMNQHRLDIYDGMHSNRLQIDEKKNWVIDFYEVFPKN